MRSVPLSTLTVPVLVKTIGAMAPMVVVPVPPLLVNVPALLNVPVPPLPFWRLPSKFVVMVSPTGLLRMPPVPITMMPAVHVESLPRFSVRPPMIDFVPPPKLTPPFASVIPAPLCVPPVHVKFESTVNVTPAVLVKVPALCWNVPTLVFDGRLIVCAVCKIAVSPAPGTPLSRFQLIGLNQLVSAPPPASQT